MSFPSPSTLGEEEFPQTQSIHISDGSTTSDESTSDDYEVYEKTSGHSVSFKERSRTLARTLTMNNGGKQALHRTYTGRQLAQSDELANDDRATAEVSHLFKELQEDASKPTPRILTRSQTSGSVTVSSRCASPDLMESTGSVDLDSLGRKSRLADTDDEDSEDHDSPERHIALLEREVNERKSQLRNAAKLGRMLGEKIKERGKIINDLHLENRCLRDEKEEQQMAIKRMTHELSQVKARFVEMQAKYNIVLEAQQSAEQELEEMQVKAEELEKLEKDKEDKKNMQWVTNQLMSNMRVKLKEQQEEAAARWEAEAVRLREEADKAAKETEALLHAKNTDIEDLTLEVQKLQRRLSDAEERLSEQRSMDQLKLQQEQARAQATLKHKEQHIASLEKEKKKADQTTAQLKEALATSESKARKLSDELSDLMEAKAVLEKKLESQAEAFENERAGLEERLKKVGQHTEEQTESLQARLVALEEERKQASAQLKKANEQHLAAVAKFKEDLRQVEEEKQRLREELEEETGKRLQGRVEEASKRYKELQEKHDRALQELTALQERETSLVADLHKNGEKLSALQADLEIAKSEVVNLNCKLQAAEQEISRGKLAASSELEEVQHKLSRSEEAARNAQADASAMRKKLMEVEHRLEDEMRASKAHITTLRYEKEDTERAMRRGMEEARAQRAPLEAKIESMRNTEEELRRKVEGLQTQLKDLQRDNRTLEEKRTTLETEVQTLQRALARAEEAEAQAVAKNKEMTNRLHRDSSVEQSRHERVVEEAKKELEEEQRRHHATEQRLTAASERWRTALEELRVEGEEKVAALKKDFVEKVEELQEKLAEARNKLSEEKTRATQLNETLSKMYAEAQEVHKAHQNALQEAQDMAAKKAHSKVAAEMRLAVSQLEGEVESLAQELERERRHSQETASREAAMAKRHGEDFRRLQKEADERLALREEEMHARVTAAEARVAQVLTEVEVMKEVRAALEKELGKARDELKRADETRKQELALAEKRATEQTNWHGNHLEEATEQRKKSEAVAAELRGQLRAAQAALDEANSAREEALREKESRLQDLAAKCEVQKSTIETLTVQNRDTQQALEAALARASAAEESVAKTLEKHQEAVQQKQEGEVRLQLSLEHTTHQLKVTEAELVRAKEAAANDFTKLQEVQSEMREAYRALRSLEGTHAKLQGDKEEVEKELKEAKKSLAEAQETSEKLLRRQVEEQRRHDILYSPRNSLSPDSLPHPGQALASREALERLRSELEHAQQEVSRHEAAVRILEQQCDELREQAAAAQKSADTRVKRAETASRETRHEVEVLQSTLRDAEARIALLETQSMKQRDAEKQLQHELERERDSSHTMKEELRILRNKIADSEKLLEDVQVQSAKALRKVRAEANEELGYHQKHAAEASEQVVRLQGMLRYPSEAPPSSPTGSMSELTAKVKELRGLVALREVELEAERHKNKQCAFEIGSLRSCVERSNAANARLRHEIEALMAAKETAESIQADLREHLKELHNSALLKQGGERLSSEASSARAAVAEAKLRAAEVELASANRTIAELESRVEAMAQQVEEMAAAAGETRKSPAAKLPPLVDGGQDVKDDGFGSRERNANSPSSIDSDSPARWAQSPKRGRALVQANGTQLWNREGSPYRLSPKRKSVTVGDSTAHYNG